MSMFIMEQFIIYHFTLISIPSLCFSNNMEKLRIGAKGHFKTSSTDINFIKLDDVLKLKKNKVTSAFNSCHVPDRANEEQIRIVSPFYDKSKCPVKGPCYCPYHRKKKSEMTNVCFRKNRPYKNKENDDLIKRGYRKVCTQQNQFKNRSKQSIRQSYSKNTKLLSGSEKQNYNTVTHKVECRNSEFEYFLKKNQLYILTGKLSNTKNGGEISELQALFESLSKNGQCLENLVNQEMGIKIRNSHSRKLTRKNIFHKQFGQDGFICKVRRLIESVLNGSKNMSIEQMDKLRAIFFNLLEQQKQFQGQTAIYLKNKECMKYFDEYIRSCLEPTIRVDKIISRKNLGIKNLNQNRRFRSSIQQNKKIMPPNIKNVKQGQIKRNSILYQVEQTNQVGSKKREENINNDKNIINQKQSLKEQIIHKNQKVLTQNIQTDVIKITTQKNTANQFRNRKNYLHKANNQSLFRETYLKQSQNSQEINQLSSDLRNELTFHYPHSSSCKKNEKQAKLEQILNQIKQETKIDENYLKMKKYIEKNKKFLRKMEIKLNDLNLGIFVIEPTDSLITRKKKIRCLKELVSNQSSQKKEFYDQIIKYLDIYTEHCNMLLKRQIKKNQEEIYFQYLEEQFIQILNSKDFTKSLKFITLQQNQEFEKQNKLQWWISIPQYVTNDFTRQKKLQRFQQSVQIVEKTQKEAPAQILEISTDQLLQKDLDNKCIIKIMQVNDDRTKKNAEEKKNQKSPCKFEKIFRRYGYSY